MSLVDPWEKAAECVRAAAATVDPERHAVLTHLRNLWVALGNERHFMSVDDAAREAAVIGRLHIELVNSRQLALH